MKKRQMKRTTDMGVKRKKNMRTKRIMAVRIMDDRCTICILPGYSGGDEGSVLSLPHDIKNRMPHLSHHRRVRTPSLILAGGPDAVQHDIQPVKHILLHAFFGLRIRLWQLRKFVF